MQFKLGAKVYTSDNQQVGVVDHIVMEPDKKEITHLVIRKGFLFTKDKVVPVSAVQSANADRVILQQIASNLDEFRDFEEKHYVPAGSEVWPEGGGSGGSKDSTQSLVGYPGIGGAPFAAEPHHVTKVRNIPEDTVALKEGAKVVTSDDHHVGNVERVVTSPESEGQATHLVISQGLLTKTRRLIPVEWIAHILEGEVYLEVDQPFLDSLPEYQAEMHQS